MNGQEVPSQAASLAVPLRPCMHGRHGHSTLAPACTSASFPSQFRLQSTPLLSRTSCVCSCLSCTNVCIFQCFHSLHQAASSTQSCTRCECAAWHVLRFRHLIFPIERRKSCIDRTAPSFSSRTILCGSRRRGRPHREDVVWTRASTCSCASPTAPMADRDVRFHGPR